VDVEFLRSKREWMEMGFERKGGIGLTALLISYLYLFGIRG